MTTLSNPTSNSQSSEGAKSYKDASKWQENVFQTLITYTSIGKGWKILDIGCGTGNNTTLLCEMVGSEGKIIGTDPIKERIKEARISYQNKNLTFHVDVGSNSAKYGCDFDVVLGNFVFHWIPSKDKLETFQGISDCLKSGGHFIFTIFKDPETVIIPFLYNHYSLLQFLPNDLQKAMKGDLFYEKIETIQKMALENGFDKVSFKEEITKLEYLSLDDFIICFAASFHICDYQYLLDSLRKVCQKEDVNFMYNEKGKVEIRTLTYYITCIKKTE